MPDFLGTVPSVDALPLSGFVYPEDTLTESTGISSYREGVSTMGVSAVADWNGQESSGTVATHRNGSNAHQVFSTEYESYYVRVWNPGGPSCWGAWVDVLFPSIAWLLSVPEDTRQEADALTLYINNFTVMPVSSGQNWGPNGGQAGHVITERNGSDGKQTFHQYSNGTSYERTYTSSAWGSWRNTRDADTLDGNDSAHFATATGLSDHLGDATDAHDATAISYAGSTNLVATQVEAALDELDTEKASTGSVTTVQTNLDNHTGDTSDAHDASAISFTPNGSIAATTVQAAIVEVRDEATGGTGLSLTEVETNLGAAPRTSGKFNITSSGLTTGRHVLITQANGPYTGKGTLTDEAQMDAITATGKVTSATNIECYWRSPTKVRGNVKFAYAVG